MVSVLASVAELDFSRYLRAGDAILWAQACAEPRTLVEHLLAQQAAEGQACKTTADGMVHRWKVPSGETAGKSFPHDRVVFSLAVSPDGKLMPIRKGQPPPNLRYFK